MKYRCPNCGNIFEGNVCTKCGKKFAAPGTAAKAPAAQQNTTASPAVKPAAANPAEKSAEKPAATKAPAAKPAEVKAPAKPAEAKPAEAKPVEAKAPAEAKVTQAPAKTAAPAEEAEPAKTAEAKPAKTAAPAAQQNAGASPTGKPAAKSAEKPEEAKPAAKPVAAKPEAAFKSAENPAVNPAVKPAQAPAKPVAEAKPIAPAKPVTAAKPAEKPAEKPEEKSDGKPDIINYIEMVPFDDMPSSVYSSYSGSSSGESHPASFVKKAKEKEEVVPCDDFGVPLSVPKGGGDIKEVTLTQPAYSKGWDAVFGIPNITKDENGVEEYITTDEGDEIFAPSSQDAPGKTRKGKGGNAYYNDKAERKLAKLGGGAYGGQPYGGAVVKKSRKKAVAISLIIVFVVLIGAAAAVYFLFFGGANGVLRKAKGIELGATKQEVLDYMGDDPDTYVGKYKWYYYSDNGNICVEFDTDLCVTSVCYYSSDASAYKEYQSNNVISATIKYGQSYAVVQYEVYYTDGTYIKKEQEVSYGAAKLWDNGTVAITWTDDYGNTFGYDAVVIS